MCHHRPGYSRSLISKPENSRQDAKAAKKNKNNN
jgi:hypothetical protein